MEKQENTELATEALPHLSVELGTSDEQRMDWLAKNLGVWNLKFYKKRWTCTKMTKYEFNSYKTMREAIDAAMNDTWQD